MKFEIEIPEEELKEAVLKVIADRYYSNYTCDKRHVDRIVAQASRECKSKAIKKILEGLDE